MIKYSKSPTHKPWSCKLSKMWTCVLKSSHINKFTVLAHMVTHMHPLQVVVHLCILWYSTAWSTVVQGLYFKPRMSRSKWKNNGDVASSAKKGQLLFWTTVHFKVLIYKSRDFFLYILCLFFMYYLYEKYYIVLYNWFGVPGGSAVKNPPAMQEPQETWVRSLGREDPLKEGMTIHSSNLSWRIPWTEDPGRLWSMRSQRVKHNWNDLASTNNRLC